MRRRLSFEARRAEIVEVAKRAIAERGYHALSLSEIARRCEMSTPGLLHYFPDMLSLLDAVLEHRSSTDAAAILDGDAAASTTLVDALQAARRYYADRIRHDEVNSFDALELEALDPNHPAHAHFRQSAERTFALLREMIDREFEHPDEVARLLRLLLDGLRLRRLRAPELPEDDADWLAILAAIERQPRRAG